MVKTQKLEASKNYKVGELASKLRRIFLRTLDGYLLEWAKLRHIISTTTSSRNMIR